MGDVIHPISPKIEYCGAASKGVKRARRRNDGYLASELETDGRQMGGRAASGERSGTDGHHRIEEGNREGRKMSGMTMTELRNDTDGHRFAPGSEPDGRQVGDGHKSSADQGHEYDDVTEGRCGTIGHRAGQKPIRMDGSSHACWDPGGVRLLGCPPSA